MTRSVRQRFSDETGQALVEFALCAVLMTALLLAVVDFGRMVLLYTTVSNAARVGARYAIVHGSDAGTPSGPANDDSNVITIVNNYAQVAGLNTSSLTVHVYYYSKGETTPACNDPGCWVKVTATYPYNPLTTYFPISAQLSSVTEGVVTF